MQSYNMSAGAIAQAKYYGGGWQLVPHLRVSARRQLNVLVQGNGNRRNPVAQRFEKMTSSSPFFTPVEYWYPTNYSSSFVQTGPAFEMGYNKTVDSSIAYNEALSRLNEKVRGGLDLSVDAFQMQQTRRMLRNVTNVVGLAREVVIAAGLGDIFSKRKEYTMLTRKQAKVVGSKWLEYQYGWRPLVGTIYDAFSKIVDPYGPSWTYPVSARGNLVQTVSSPYVNAAYKGTQVDTLRTRVEIGLVLSPAQSRLQALAGFTSLNPVSIAWELMPYSFVVDWFYNIGDYLRNAETAWLWADNFQFGYVTTTAWNSRVLTPTPYQSWNGYLRLTFNGTPGRSDYRYKDRAVLSSYPLPRKLQVHAKLGSERLLSAAALLSQFLGKR